MALWNMRKKEKKIKERKTSGVVGSMKSRGKENRDGVRIGWGKNRAVVLPYYPLMYSAPWGHKSVALWNMRKGKKGKKNQWLCGIKKEQRNEE